MLSNPIPAIRVYLDAEAALKKSFKFLLQGDDLDGRKEITGEDVVKAHGKVFPFLNVPGKVVSQGQRVFG